MTNTVLAGLITLGIGIVWLFADAKADINRKKRKELERERDTLFKEDTWIKLKDDSIGMFNYNDRYEKVYCKASVPFFKSSHLDPYCVAVDIDGKNFKVRPNSTIDRHRLDHYEELKDEKMIAKLECLVAEAVSSEWNKKRKERSEALGKFNKALETAVQGSKC